MVIKLAAMPADAIAAVMSTAHLFIAINMYRLQSLDYTSSKTMVVGNPVTPTAKETQDPRPHPMPSRMSTHWHPQQTGK